MKAVQFAMSIPRYLLTKAIGTFYPSIFWSTLACLQYREVSEPKLPSQDWVKVKVKYAGICGSDMNLIYLRDSPYISPFSSFPFTIGHENLGIIIDIGDKVEDFNVGDRVVVDPALFCSTRGFTEPCVFCRRGDFSLCERFAEGTLAPGLIIGACRDTGGGWSQYFVAHKFQLFRVPKNVSDENAILVDPFCSALHPVMRNFPNNDDVVLVVGVGVIGLCVVAALRVLGSKARIITLAKYGFQGELARRYGADEVIYIQGDSDYYNAIARSVDGKLYKPVLGKRVLVGGADLVFECIGSEESIDDALRFTKSGSKMVLVGLAAIPKRVDWTPIWLNELEVKGSFGCSTETYQGEQIPTYQVALNLMAEGKLDLNPLLTHKFNLANYREAIATTVNKGRNKVVKTVFTFE